MLAGYTVPALAVGTVTAAAVCTGATLGWYAYRYGDHPLSNRFAQLMAVETLWALVYLLQLFSPTDSLATGLLAVKTLPALLASVLLFLFVVEYTGDSAWLPEWTGPALVLETGLYWVAWLVAPGGLVTEGAGLVTFGGLRVVFDQFGPVAGLQLLFLYGLLLASTVLLGRFYLQSRNLFRRQTGLILLSTLVVIVGNAVYRAGYAPHPRLDITPILFAVQAVGVFVALYYYDFLNTAPMAADTLLEEVSDLVFVLDTDYRVVDYNTAAAQWLPTDDSKPPLSAVTIDGLAALAGDDIVDTDDPISVTTLEEGVTTESTTYDVRVTPIRDQFEVVRGYVLVCRDVTDRRAREQALRNQNERLEEFATVVSHDLRTPLSVVDGNIELAYQSGDVERLERAREATDRMERLLDDLLSIAREGQLIRETEPVEIDAVAADAWANVETGTATLRAQTDMRVEADSSRLQEAFENLFNNAVEHGSTASQTQSDGGIENRDETLTVDVGAFSSGFYVADDGPGIPEDERDRVLDMGYSSTEDGTGFGLAIVERIVDAHGWDLAVTESETGGARFEVTGLYPSVFDADRSPEEGVQT